MHAIIYIYIYLFIYMHAIYGHIHCSPVRKFLNMNFSKSAIKGEMVSGRDHIMSSVTFHIVREL